MELPIFEDGDFGILIDLVLRLLIFEYAESTPRLQHFAIALRDLPNEAIVSRSRVGVLALGIDFAPIPLVLVALPSHFFCLVFECVINSLVYLSLFSRPIWRFSKLNTSRVASIALCSILFFLQLVLHFFGQVGLPIFLPKWATRLHLRPCEQLLLLRFSFLRLP